jgi:predicted alpha/beta hydrolase family esterase
MCFPSDWQKIRKNADWIVQLHSAADDVIPVAEGRFIAEKLQSEYIELERRGHFVDEDLPEVARVIKEKTFSRQG